ncbi:MAG: hypothetical protein R3A51_22875 [Nannocystaceae bacterium]|nr:hypothetical protein [Myxococcales bacterium]
MSASVFGPGGRAGLRVALAVVLCFDVGMLLWQHAFHPAPVDPLPWEPAFLRDLHAQTWLLDVLAGLAIAGAFGFAFARKPLAPGLVALAAIGLLNESFSAYISQPWRMFFSAGAMLCGWLFGLVIARVTGADPERADRLGEAGATAGLAATYVGAGIQKLVAGGFLQSRALRAHIFTHHEVDDVSPLGHLSQLVATTPWMAEALEYVVVVIQVGAILYLVGPRLRMLWGALLICFHLGTLVFLHIIYIEATALLLAFSFPWGRLRSAAAPTPAPEEPPIPARVARGVILLLIALALVAWSVPTPGEVPSRVVYSNPAPVEANELPARVRVHEVESLGPLARGQALAGWTLRAIEVGEREALLHLARGEQEVVFGLAGPGGAVERGPHNFRDVSLYYRSTDVPFAEFNAAGNALRDQIAAAAGDPPGAAVDAWIVAAYGG